MQQLNKFHKTTSGYVVFGLIELLIAYGFVSLAIDRGNWEWYLLTLLFLIGGVLNLIKAVEKLFHGRHKTNAA